MFFNRPFTVSENDPVHIALQNVYNKYMLAPQKPHRFTEEKCLEIVYTIKQYGFVDAVFKLYHNTRTFDAESYVMLLNTYSVHRALTADKRAIFEKEIIEAIDSCGGKFTLYDK